MRGRRLAFILLLIALSIPVSARPAARPAPADVRPMQYLPLVATAPIPVEIVETGRGVLEGYPSDYYVYGYVRNLTLTPLYSVTLELEITIYPYDPGGNPPPYTERVQVDYPVGHRLRRAEGLPLLKAKFEAAVRAHYPARQAEDLIERAVHAHDGGVPM